MDKLQIAIIGGAVILAVVVVLVFTGAMPGLRMDEGTAANLVMWGFGDEALMRDLILKFSESRPNFEVRYKRVTTENFENDLLNALASGNSPDVIVFPAGYLKKHKDKLASAPPILFTEREIRQNYVDAGAVFLGDKKEVLGAPFYADAAVLYWNKDIFSKNLLTLPPKTWDEFLDDAAKLTKKDSSGNILISGAALGRGTNIKNAPLVLTALFLQSGEKIINNSGEVVLNNPLNVGQTTLRPAESSLRFMTDFANPRKTAQGWSGALPEAEEFFIAGKLAMYLGRISEYVEITNKNPHLSFGVSPLPQLADAPKNITAGEIFALAVPKASRNQRQSWEFIKFLSEQENSAAYADKAANVSLRRDILPNYLGESAKSAFAESVLALQIWPNPDPLRTDAIFRELIEDAATGRSTTLRDALEKAKSRLGEI
ncbi:MAG: extracellular solute-binding protein [Candidatus Giovannonibacteria bacterium]|nr:MAG: extracellular solute-binding protein [Candidatus Giovannonibacteria bacterium]